MAELSIRDLHFQRGDFLLKLASVKVVTGEKIAILGENGSGKSTLLQLLTGLLASQKAISFAEQPLENLSMLQRAQLFSLLPQQAEVIFPFTVFEVILFGRFAQIQGQSPSEADLQTTRQLLQQFELEGLATRNFNQLSGGEQRRVMLARVLNQQARILFLDEPNASLDVRHSLEIFDYLHRQQHTLIAPVHDINLAARFFERFWLLKRGKMLADVPRAGLSCNLLSETFDVKVSAVADSFVFSR